MNKSKKFYIIIGAPCSGKGTQGALLNKKINHISAGNILREMYPPHTEIGQRLNAGQIVATEIVCDAIMKKFQESQNSVLIDGFPRTADQAYFVKKAIDEGKINLGKIFVLQANKEILEERTLKRTMCKDCQLTFIGDQMCCDKPTSRRDDDTVDILRKRYDIYNNDIMKILDILSGPIYFINGEDTIENINHKLLQLID